MANKITWDDKVAINPRKVRINQVQDRDMNEIKNMHNLDSDKIDSLVSGFQGSLLIADTPTADGLYIASESGTYINAGGLVVNISNTISFISVISSQTVFELTEVPISTLGYSIVTNLNDFDALISNSTQGSWIILEDFALDSNKTIPSGVTLTFNGAVISGAFTITGDDTAISANLVKIFETDVLFSGTWNVTQIFPEWFGSVKDGVTNDTDAVKSTIQFSVNQRTTIHGTVKRGSSTIRFGSGIYLINSGTLSNYSGSDIRGLVFEGDGMYNTSILLAGDGDFFEFTDPLKQHFSVFSKIGFYGDSYFETLPNDATNPVSVNRKFMSSTTSGIQGFRFNECLFQRFGEVFQMYGTNNDAEFTFVSCKANRNGDWIVLKNNQAFNWNHYSTDIEVYTGSILRLPSGGGGASVHFYGGSIIPFEPTSRRYIVEVASGSSIRDFPTVLFDGVRFEVRYSLNGIAKIEPTILSQVIFKNCGFVFNQGNGSLKRLAEIGSYGKLNFYNCAFKEEETIGTNEWYMTGGSGSNGEQGLISFEDCIGDKIINPDLVVLGSEGSVHGIVYAKNTLISDVGSAGDSSTTLDWTVATDWFKDTGKNSVSPPIHRCALMSNYAPDNAQRSYTVKLPKNALILRIVGYIKPQGSSSASITYSLDDGDSNNFFTETVAEQKNGTYFEVKPTDFPNGIAQAVIGDTNNLRTLTFSANSGSHQVIRGVGFIEYM